MTSEIHKFNPKQQYFVCQIAEHLETLLRENDLSIKSNNKRTNLKSELKTISLWRAIVCEFFISFVYVLIVCATAAGTGVGASVSTVLFATSIASGCSMAALTHCFYRVSGSHINPVVTLCATLTRQISLVRCIGYILAQVCGSIAAAFLLYRDDNLIAAIPHIHKLPVSTWQNTAVECILTFTVVQVYFACINMKNMYNNAALIIGAAYGACTLASMPYLNPARALGPSVVLRKWDNSFVYWVIPIAVSLVHLVIVKFFSNDYFVSKKNSDENCTIEIDDSDNEIRQQGHATSKLQQSTFGNINFTQPLFNEKLESPEPLYGGTRSMYSRSPPMSRASLNRSQSVYTKSNSALNRDNVTRNGALVPAQSLYLRTTQNQNAHIQNQNLQNQRTTENIYGRNSMRMSGNNDHLQSIYGTKQYPNPQDSQNIEQRKVDREQISKEMYDANKIHCANTPSDDSCYGSYQSPQATPPVRNNGESQQKHHMLLYMPHNTNTANQPRTQSERKVSGTPVINGITQGNSSNPVDRQLMYAGQNQQIYSILPLRPT